MCRFIFCWILGDVRRFDQMCFDQGMWCLTIIVFRPLESMVYTFMQETCSWLLSYCSARSVSCYLVQNCIPSLSNSIILQWHGFWFKNLKRKYYLGEESSQGAIRLAPLAFVAAEDLTQAIYYLHHAINCFEPICLHHWWVVFTEIKVLCLQPPVHLKHGHVKSQVILMGMFASGLMLFFGC